MSESKWIAINLLTFDAKFHVETHEDDTTFHVRRSDTKEVAKILRAAADELERHYK